MEKTTWFCIIHIIWYRSYSNSACVRLQVEKFRNRILEKDTLIEQISSKASKRIHVLEANWNKAEKELCRLDDLVDSVRSALISHELASEDPRLTRLLAVIDGQESLSALRKELKPKTKESQSVKKKTW